MIREWLAWGFEPPIVVIEPLTLDEAVTYEKAFIAAIGRHDKGLGSLTNQNDGHKLDEVDPRPIVFGHRRTGGNSEVEINRFLRRRDPLRSLRTPQVTTMPHPPKQTPPSWTKPLRFEVTKEQRADRNRHQAQKLQLAGLLRPAGPRVKNKGRLSPEQT
jgi:hypothetical protein